VTPEVEAAAETLVVQLRALGLAGRSVLKTFMLAGMASDVPVASKRVHLALHMLLDAIDAEVVREMVSDANE
jgi:hypothetical protein